MVCAAFDADAEVWYVADTSLSGLNAEAESIEELARKLPAMIEDLLEDGGN